MANGTKKKEKKVKTETETETKTAAPPDNTANTANQAGQPEPKKKNGCLVGAIIAIAFFLLIGALVLFWMWPFIFSFFMDLRSGDISLPKTTQTQNAKGTLKGKNLAGLIDPSKTVTKRISAKNGGQITVRTASGLYFTLKIAPGSLEKDTDITLTPISESPIEGYPNPDDPGVVIGPDNTNLGDGSTVTVSEDPPVEPADPGSSGADPGTGTGPGGDPNSPTDNPPGTGDDGGTTTPPGISGELPDLSHLADLLGNNNTMTTTPSGNPSGQGGSGTTGNTGANRDDRNAGGNSPSGGGAGSGRFSDRTVIIFTGYGGGVSGTPTSHSDDGDSATAPIDETGAASSDDPDEGESGDLADNAATASSGDCTPGFMQAMAGASQAGGAGSQAAQAALRNCLNTEWLNNLCVNDPVKLRRTYFQQRIALARRFDERAAVEIESLMNQCQAQYHFYGEGINPASSNGVMIFSSLDATVCGYVDDEWTGNQIYRLSVDGGGEGHYFEGSAKFNLPAGGGQFSGVSHGSSSMNVGNRSVAVPQFDFGFLGTFDGVKTILNLNLYPATIVSSISIDLQGKDCAPLVPLAP